uniref:Uncharacterized protein n=1 Tax=Oryza rufipogon TaxID=4529 RepID=A0A0E0PWY3_ORYRU
MRHAMDDVAGRRHPHGLRRRTTTGAGLQIGHLQEDGNRPLLPGCMTTPPLTDGSPRHHSELGLHTIAPTSRPVTRRR